MKKLALLTTLFATNALACSCANYPTLKEKVESAAVIAITEASLVSKTIEYDLPKLVYKFTPIETLKGITLDEYVLIEEGPRTNCDIPVEPHKKYLVFHVEGNELALGVCAATEAINEFTNNDRIKKVKALIASGK